MKSKPTGSGESILSSQYNSGRDDARGGGFLLAHQQFGAIALPTNPTNGQTLTVTVNGTAIVITYVSAIGSTANNVLIQGTAALTAAATLNFLRRPDLSNSNQIAATASNQQLLQYAGYSLPTGGTTITPYSLNKNVNGATAPLTSFTASTTVTGASWTAQTMQLYIEDGTYYIGTTRVLFLGSSTPTFTAPISNPRIDIVTADSSGTIAVVTGTENVSPVPPAYPANKIVLAEVYHVVGETAIYDNENQQAGQGYIVNDVRTFLAQAGYIASLTQVASGLFIPDPGSEAQGDILYYNGSAWVRLPAGASGYVLQTKGASANPQWVPLALTATVKDVSGPNITPPCDGSYHTVATYANIPVITANQTIWIRGYYNNADTHSATARGLRLTFNGTDVFDITLSNSAGNTQCWFDVMFVVPTPASAQTYLASVKTGLVGSFSDLAPAVGTSSANVSATWTLLVQEINTVSGSPTASGAMTLSFFEVNILN